MYLTFGPDKAIKHDYFHTKVVKIAPHHNFVPEIHFFFVIQNKSCENLVNKIAQHRSFFMVPKSIERNSIRFLLPRYQIEFYREKMLQIKFQDYFL